MNGKVVLVSTRKGKVGVNIPDLKLRRIWPQKGAKVAIDKEVLKEAMYDPGLSYMLEQGILYIEDMETKKELELEPEDAKEPENIIILTDAQKKRYLTVAPIQDFREMLSKISRNQAVDLAQYAIENKITDMERNKLLKKASEIDVMQAIMLADQTEV